MTTSQFIDFQKVPKQIFALYCSTFCSPFYYWLGKDKKKAKKGILLFFDDVNDDGRKKKKSKRSFPLFLWMKMWNMGSNEIFYDVCVKFPQFCTLRFIESMTNELEDVFKKPQKYFHSFLCGTEDRLVVWRNCKQLWNEKNA